MDIVKAPLFAFLAVVMEFGFWDGLGHALAVSSIPHTAQQLGESFGFLVLFCVSQLVQWWRTRHAVSSQVTRAVARHLSTTAAPAPAPEPGPAAAPARRRKKAPKNAL